LTSVLRHFNFKQQTILKINASDYVKDEILSQYDDESVLYLIVFYSKSMILAECNYHIYDKKLLIIIQCFKHWRLKLKCIELLIQIFIDHQTLKIFMKNKQLTQHQVNYLNILSKFNFQIIFQSGKINIKVNALIRMLIADIFESAQRIEDHYLLRMCQRSNSNQFTVNASKFTAYWLELVNNLIEIWLKSDLDLIKIWLSICFIL